MDETARTIGQLQASVDAVRADIATMRHELNELLALKQRGWGVFIGVALVASALGSQASRWLNTVMHRVGQ